jgi:hypothetical protein
MVVVRVDGVRLCLWTVAIQEPIVHLPDDIWVWSHGRLKATEENQKSQRKICHNATLSTTDPIWTDQGPHVEKLAINHLSHGTRQM